ncbi:MAG TPA: glycosyltransferase family 4 protein [Thermoanaerobaculia bacterium]|nr:glycosyltransferase family 4 protein [Thermoanaerobaculia bacterium]
MKVAQVAPLYESVPPELYGGTERVVSYLTEELVRQGHDVTLFASGDSVTSARLISTCRRALRLDPDCVDQIAHHLVMLEEVYRRADDFDVIHFHVDYFHFPWSRRHTVRHLTTLHGRLDIPDLVPLYREYPEMPVVSISDSQREPLPWLNWLATVHHGLPPDLHSCGEEPGDYLVFLGRISPEKRPDLAIEIAGRAGLPLKIAAKVDKADREYFEQAIRPLLSQPHVELLGEVDERDKGELLGGARALLFPIDWPEPFGMVMIEAMACGTPVIAFRRGSVPEVMVDGRSGFVCGNVNEAVAAVGRLSEVSRQEVRRVFEERFTAERMARDYVAIYQRLLKEDRTNADPRSVGALLDSGDRTAGR